MNRRNFFRAMAVGAAACLPTAARPRPSQAAFRERTVYGEVVYSCPVPRPGAWFQVLEEEWLLDGTRLIKKLQLLSVSEPGKANDYRRCDNTHTGTCGDRKWCQRAYGIACEQREFRYATD